MSEQHVPDPEFLARLRWQIESEARRRARFGSANTARRIHWKATVLLAAGISLGAAGTVAAGEIGRRQDRSKLLAEVGIELELAQAELHLMSSEQERIEVLADAGAVSNSELSRARHAAFEAITKLQILQLGQAEIRATGQAPDRGLAAPLVEGQDFVSKEMALTQASIAHRIELLKNERERVSVQHEAGFVSVSELREAERDLLLAETQLEGIIALKNLRLHFLGGTLAPSSAVLAAKIHGARMQAHRLVLHLNHAHSQAKIRAAREATGIAKPDPRAEFELARLEAKHQLAKLRLKTLLRDAQGLPAGLLGGEALKVETLESTPTGNNKR